MDCREVQELLDAYALGAAESAEARVLEEHAADCVRCWQELSQAQQAAALLALSIPLERAPAGLEARILARAGREARRRPTFRLPRSLWRAWPAAGGAFAAAAAAALAFAVVLQVEVTDLRDENGQLEGQLRESSAVLEQQGQLMAVLAAPDSQEVLLQPTAPGQDVLGVYYWSRSSRKGFFLGSGLPALQEGQVYQVWFMTEDEAIPLATFESWDGSGQASMDLSALAQRPQGIGVSVEEAGGGRQPGGELLLFASLTPQ